MNKILSKAQSFKRCKIGINPVKVEINLCSAINAQRNLLMTSSIIPKNVIIIFA